MDEAATRAGAQAEAPGWLALLARPDVWLIGLAVAVFLGLYWALRGAPVGQPIREPGGPDAPPTGRRDRLVALASAGVVLVAFGAFVSAYYGIPWSIPVFGAGFAALLLADRGARPHRHASPVLRRVSRFSETALTASLLAGILVVANVAAFRYGDRPLDLTRERVHTLEPITTRWLDALDRPVRFTAFYYSRATNVPVVKQVDRIQQLLRLFKEENPDKVSVDFVDFHGEPGRAEELARRVPDAAISSGGVVIELGEGEDARRMVVRNGDMFGDPSGAEAGALASEFRGEYALTTALMRLKEGKRPKIAMTSGHGESPSNGPSPSTAGSGLLRARLTDVGFEVVDVDLAKQDVPEETAFVMAVAPRSPFSEAEVRRLTDYLAKGGRGLFLVSGRAKTGLEPFLSTYNVELDSALVVERSPLGGMSQTLQIIVPPSAEHPIVRPLVGQRVIFPGATPLTVRTSATAKAEEAGPPTNPGVSAQPILRTGPGAWGETDLAAAVAAFDPKTDVPGPVSVGVAVAAAATPGGPPDPDKPILAIFSSPDLADNRILGLGAEANLDLVVNAANWLRGRLDLPQIAPRTRTVARLDPDPTIQARMILLPTLMAFTIVLSAGMLVYLVRRS